MVYLKKMCVFVIIECLGLLVQILFALVFKQFPLKIQFNTV